MVLLARNPWLVLTVLLVPWLTLAAPPWLRLAGVPPAWGLLWLLPWALVEGRFSGLFAGLAAGLLLDALVPSGVSQVPGLMALGWWWGRLGRRGPPIERSFNLGLLALLGTGLLDLSLMLQWLLRSSLGGGVSPLDPARMAQPGWHGSDLAAAGVHVFLAQTLLTALLAPVLCSLLLLLFRHQAGSGWRS